VTLFINFITAASWIWGGAMALGVVLGLLVATLPDERLDKESITGFIRSGFLAWAWLIARYCL
jgi:hypothetical protein